jgi:hypothetical protein
VGDGGRRDRASADCCIGRVNEGLTYGRRVNGGQARRWPNGSIIFAMLSRVSCSLLHLHPSDNSRLDNLISWFAASILVTAPNSGGIRLNEHVEADGPTARFKMGLEGLVSKRQDSSYRSGRSPGWLKMKNPNAPAVKREAEEDWGR